jgi:signal recognition particle receptor subunit beta
MQSLILISLIVGLLIIAVIGIVFRSGSLPGKKAGIPAFLIVGPSYSGKTALFLQWTTGKVPQTVSSQAANESTINVPLGEDSREKYKLIDLPGHPKLGYLYEAEIRSRLSNSLKGIIVVVDSAGGAKSISKAAQVLYKVLELTETKAGGIDILIAANKSDVFNAVSGPRLKTLLEQEIDSLRESIKKSVGDVKTHGEDDIWVGSEGKMSFTQLESQITVLDGSVSFGKVSKWEEWLETVVANSQ